MSETQGSPEWHAKRCGRITASRFKSVMALGKKDKKPLQERDDYLAELVLERLTGKSIGIPMTPPMLYGKDVEPHARAAYEAARGVLVRQVDFIIHPEHPFVGASPDGLVDADGGMEAKCPWNPIIHMRTLINGMPDEHIPQVQGNLWVTGRKWWDFISYDPRQIPELRLYVQRIERDAGYIASLQAECLKLNIEVNTLMQALLDRANALEAA